MHESSPFEEKASEYPIEKVNSRFGLLLPGKAIGFGLLDEAVDQSLCLEKIHNRFSTPGAFS